MSWLVARLAAWAEGAPVNVGVARGARGGHAIRSQYGGARAGSRRTSVVARCAPDDVPAGEERAQRSRVEMRIPLDGKRLGRVTALTRASKLGAMRVLMTACAVGADAGESSRCAMSGRELLRGNGVTRLALEGRMLPGQWESRVRVLERQRREFRRLDGVTRLTAGADLSEVNVFVTRDARF